MKSALGSPLLSSEERCSLLSYGGGSRSLRGPDGADQGPAVRLMFIDGTIAGLPTTEEAAA